MALVVMTTLGDLENASEARVDERIIPSIAELDVPLVITAEVYLDALWTYILGLARAGDEELQDKPSAAEIDGSQTDGYVQIPLGVTMSYHARTNLLANRLPKGRALAILEEIDEAERLMWAEIVRGLKAGMVIHQIMMELEHVWVWHEKPGERQPATPMQPQQATKIHHQPDRTPRAVNTWAAENKGGRPICQAHQQNQCAGNPHSMGAHVCAMVARDSGHGCGMEHPVCKHT